VNPAEIFNFSCRIVTGGILSLSGHDIEGLFFTNLLPITRQKQRDYTEEQNGQENKKNLDSTSENSYSKNEILKPHRL